MSLDLRLYADITILDVMSHSRILPKITVRGENQRPELRTTSDQVPITALPCNAPKGLSRSVRSFERGTAGAIKTGCSFVHTIGICPSDR